MAHNSRRVITYSILLTFIFFPFHARDKRKVDWFPFYIPWNYCEGSKLDVSFLLDAPAGKHGFVVVKNGHFYFEDGERARFWGLNIHSNRACFPDRAQADEIARRLAQLGCNIVRMHLLDQEAPAGIIDGNFNDSQHFSASQLDRLDYFVYKLKQNGIYICFDVLGLGARRFKSGDNVVDVEQIPPGARGISIFDERIKELGKIYARKLLTHVNPYTGNAYINEPAVAMVEMTNENTIFLKNSYKYFSPYYRKEINALWHKWLAERGYIKDINRKEWSQDREFLFKLQDEFQQDMYRYLRSIGVKVPIGGSNVPYDNLTLLADTRMDFVDIHVYWDLSDRLDRIHNRPLIKQSHFNPYTIINTMAIAKFRQKPLVSTEWGSNWPNDWRAVDILTTAAYATLNDWDALLLYAYNGGWDMSWDRLSNKLYYGTVIFNDPAKMGLFPLASLIFLGGDVRRAKDVYSITYNMDKLYRIGTPYRDRLKLAGIPYVSRSEKIFYNGKDDARIDVEYPGNLVSNNGAGLIISDTGELIRDYKRGIFILKSPTIFSYAGFVGRGGSYTFSGIRFYTESNFATITIVSLDGERLSSSKHLLLTAVGKARNTGQKFAPHTGKRTDDLRRDVYILNAGKSPIMVEGIKGEIFIKSSKEGERLYVFGLNEKGQREIEIPVRTDNNGHWFRISGDWRTIYYEIVRG